MTMTAIIGFSNYTHDMTILQLVGALFTGAFCAFDGCDPSPLDK